MTPTPRQQQPCSGYVLVRLLRPVRLISLRLQSALFWHESKEAAMRQRKAQRHKLAVDSTTFAPMCSGRDRACRGGRLQMAPQIGHTRGGAGPRDSQ
jgi:hypothetical protein